MPGSLETIVECSMKVGPESFKELSGMIALDLIKIGFIKKDGYWENESLGPIRVYPRFRRNIFYEFLKMFKRETHYGTLKISLKSQNSKSSYPPAVDLIYNRIEQGEWMSLTTKRKPKYKERGLISTSPYS